MGNKQSLDEQQVINLCDQLATNPDTLPQLSESDIRLVQNVWIKVVTNTEKDVGIELFKKIFEKSQPIRNLFNVNETDMQKLDSNGRFISHARIVKNALDAFIRHLHSTNGCKLVDDLRALGARHIYLRKEGFGPDLWYHFVVCTTEICHQWKTPRFKKQRFQQLWAQIICFVIVNMRLGYQEELKKTTTAGNAITENENELLKGETQQKPIEEEIQPTDNISLQEVAEGKVSDSLM